MKQETHSEKQERRPDTLSDAPVAPGEQVLPLLPVASPSRSRTPRTPMPSRQLILTYRKAQKARTALDEVDNHSDEGKRLRRKYARLMNKYNDLLEKEESNHFNNQTGR